MRSDWDATLGSGALPELLSTDIAYAIQPPIEVDPRNGVHMIDASSRSRMKPHANMTWGGAALPVFARAKPDVKRGPLAAMLILLLSAGTANADRPTPIDLTPKMVDIPRPVVTVNHPVWSRNAIMYEMNVRQFTKEGTLRSAEVDLPHLQKLGVDILWLMPVHPIGQAHRLGAFGSPYSVRDYLAVDPALGSITDLRHFVETAHRLGLHVIMDWVANHSAFDNPLVAEHPDWYMHDDVGRPRPPLWVDWQDVVEFDYSKPQLRRYMTEAMKFWVRETGIDGYRADFAGGVPLQFWENARSELEMIKPVFMLAEWEYPGLNRRAFDASYAWKLATAMKDVAAGRADADALDDYFNTQEQAWPREAFKLGFVSNHDVSMSEGSDCRLFGPALPAMIAFTFAAETMPLIYNGEEVGNARRINYLTRDPIDWHGNPRITSLYRQLIAFKKSNPALANGQYGGAMYPIHNDAPHAVFSFVREAEHDKVLAIFNFSAIAHSVSLEGREVEGVYLDLEGKSEMIWADEKIELQPWSFRLLAERAPSFTPSHRR